MLRFLSKYKILIGCLVIIPAVLVYGMLCSWPLPKPEPLNAELPSAKPPKDMAIFQIKTGVIHRNAAFGYRGGSFFDNRDFTMSGVLVKHPKGDLLIDTGFGRDIQAHFAAMPFYFRATADLDSGISAADQLQEAGYDQKSLRILLTHGHWDHVSGVPDFPETPVLVNHEELDFIQSDNSLSALMRSFPNVKYEKYVFKDKPYLNFPKSCDLYEDGSIVIVPTPGHTPGSVIIFIALPSGQRFAMIGDLTWQLEGIWEREERPWIQSVMGDNDRELVRENILRMAAIAERFPEITIVPAHDTRGFEKMPKLDK